MGNIVIASPFQRLQVAANPVQQSLTHFGSPVASWVYSGAVIDFAVDVSGAGTASVLTLPTVPADAVALELWSNGTGATDYLFYATRAGQLSSAGAAATRITDNLGTTGSVPNRYVTSGAHAIIPFVTVGTAPSTLRVAGRESGGDRVQGRFISQSASFPYLLASTTEFLMLGAGASQQLPFSDGTRFPTGYSAVVFQISGTGVARMTFDGTTPSATLGDILAPGRYLIDFAKHGISVTALRFYLPSGTNIIGSSLFDA